MLSQTNARSSRLLVSFSRSSSAIKAMLLRCETVKVAIKAYQIKRMSSRAFYLEISAWRYGIIVKTITKCERIEERASASIGRGRVRGASPPMDEAAHSMKNTEIPIQRRCMVCLRDAIFIKITSFGWCSLLLLLASPLPLSSFVFLLMQHNKIRSNFPWVYTLLFLSDEIMSF